MKSTAPIPPMDEARLDRQLERALVRTQGLKTRRRILRAAAVVAFTAAMALVISFGWPRSSTGPSIAGTSLETTTGVQIVTLPDGTRLTVGPQTQLQFRVAKPDLVQIAMTRGDVDFDVTHDPKRSFDVVCGERTIHVLGTRFHVVSDGSQFAVTVSRGRVRVQGPEGSLELAAGESWSHGDQAALDVPVASDSSTAPQPATTTSTVEPAVSVARAPTAVDLFARAQAARIAGRPAEAAREFDALRRNHRSDSRAGLAAFELGRIRLDDLGDPSGAADAFTDAIDLSPSASYREDAEARRVEALDRMHDVPRCTAARDAYVVRYPQGVFRAAVTKRCAGP